MQSGLFLLHFLDISADLVFVLLGLYFIPGIAVHIGNQGIERHLIFFAYLGSLFHVCHIQHFLVFDIQRLELFIVLFGLFFVFNAHIEIEALLI